MPLPGNKKQQAGKIIPEIDKSKKNSFKKSGRFFE
jgi:hypothetical protein